MLSVVNAAAFSVGGWIERMIGGSDKERVGHDKTLKRLIKSGIIER